MAILWLPFEEVNNKNIMLAMVGFVVIYIDAPFGGQVLHGLIERNSDLLMHGITFVFRSEVHKIEGFHCHVVFIDSIIKYCFLSICGLTQCFT